VKYDPFLKMSVIFLPLLPEDEDARNAEKKKHDMFYEGEEEKELIFVFWLLIPNDEM
jgi:hypothetical protein